MYDRKASLSTYDIRPSLSTVPSILDYETSITEAFDQHKYTDASITCGPRSWRVHKLIVCTRSRYFRKAFDGVFKEARVSKVKLIDDDPESIDVMIRYLYTREIAVREPPLTMQLAISVYRVGDKYMIEGLQASAFKELESRIKAHWRLSCFPAAIEELYANPPNDRTLHDLVLTWVKYQARSLVVKKEKYPEFHQLLRSNLDFAADVAETLADALVDNHRALQSSYLDEYHSPWSASDSDRRAPALLVAATESVEEAEAELQQ